MSRRLTDAAVQRLKPDPNKRLEIPDAGKPGLYLVIQPSGRKSWAVRYRHQGKPRKLTLDGFPSVGIAHKLAQAALDAAAGGHDPAKVKREQKRLAKAGGADRDLFKNVKADFVERYVKPNTRPSSAKETERLLDKKIMPQWRDKRVQEITKRDVIELLDGVVDAGGGLTANRVFAAIRRLFNWCVERDVIAMSPCAGLTAPVAERSRDRVLSDAEIRWLAKACDKVGQPFGHMVALLLLTGQRRNEVAGMTSRELDVDERTWGIPGSRTKNGEPHIVPLSKPALETIANVKRITSKAGYILTTTGTTPVSGFSRGKARLDRIMLEIAQEEARKRGDDPKKVVLPEWRLHDLRRTVASGMARLGINLPVIEKVLNHTSGSFAGVVGVYQRHHYTDEKRQALDTWGRFVISLVDDKPAENVRELRKVAS